MRNFKKLNLIRLKVAESYKKIEQIYKWIKKKIGSSNTPDFFSKEMIITKRVLNENQFKYTYKHLISELDYKQKE